MNETRGGAAGYRARRTASLSGSLNTATTCTSFLGLKLQALGGGRALFDQSRVLLCCLIPLRHGLAGFGRALALFDAGGGDLTHDVGRAPDRTHHLELATHSRAECRLCAAATAPAPRSPQ